MKKLAVALGPMLDFVTTSFPPQSVEAGLVTMITACLPLASKVWRERVFAKAPYKPKTFLRLCSQRIDLIDKLKGLGRADLTPAAARASVDWLLARGHSEILAATIDHWLCTALTGKVPATSKASGKGSKAGRHEVARVSDLALSTRGDCGPQALRALQLLLVSVLQWNCASP